MGEYDYIMNTLLKLGRRQNRQDDNADEGIDNYDNLERFDSSDE